MEALGAAASIAGLVSLAGQLLTLAAELRGFFNDVAKAPKNIEDFLKELNNLIRTLEGTKNLCERVEKQNSAEQIELSVASLKIQLEDCSKDISSWIIIARKYYIGDRIGYMMKFKKFWVAANKNAVLDIRSQIQTHCQFISTSLEVLGRYG
jgi:hypothetical protein